MNARKRMMACGAALALGAGMALAQGSQPETGPGGRPRGEGDTTETYERHGEGTTPEKNLRTVTMTVRTVNSKAHRVTLDVQVSPEANITESGQPIKLDQLKPGDQVRASFDPKTGDVMKLQVTQKGTGIK